MKNPNSRKKGNTYFENTGKDKKKETDSQRRTFNKSGYSEDAKDVVKENTEVAKDKNVTTSR
ncbi:hypothetical protein HNQ91_002774 [Filimonas zeae]|uniref:Uncharacterized protein n=1 Tax=Filimonas zeae TaxID=1737353 RepID=A0A917IZ44_9BACT|nr:hypothetical protein [Filimonas zeae]MDR6339709.1 hypothetical protein [Filimonas zeae]GGH69254.1 hypothetical protein GCM10011379_26390 [Filimonas zeae]